MKIQVEYYPTFNWYTDGVWFCGHPDTRTEIESNAWGEDILVSRCSECGAWCDETTNTFEEE